MPVGYLYVGCFEKLHPETQALVQKDAQRICDLAWDTFIKTLPRRARLEEDITPALPGIKRDYYAKYMQSYCYVAGGLLEQYQLLTDQIRQAHVLYEQELARELRCIEYEHDLLTVLEHMVPDPNLRDFDLQVRYAKRLCADAITEGVLTGKSPLRRIGARLRERNIRNYVRNLDAKYEALEPRTQLMRRREYEDAMRMAAFALGEDGIGYESLPIDVRNKVACRLHAADRFQEEQETGS